MIERCALPGCGAGTLARISSFTCAQEGDTLLRLDETAAGGIRTQSGLRKMACDWQVEQATPPDVGRIVAALL